MSDQQDTSWIVGLDLGQAADFTALVGIERVPLFVEPAKVVPPADLEYEYGPYGRSRILRPDPPKIIPLAPPPPKGYKLHRYSIAAIHRFDLGTHYDKIVEFLCHKFNHSALTGCKLVVDATGVGRPVVDMCRAAITKGVECQNCVPSTDSNYYCEQCGGTGRIKLQAQIIPVTITGGQLGGAAPDTALGGWRVPKKDLVGALQVLMQSGRLKLARGLPLAKILISELEQFRVKITTSGNESLEAWRERAHDDLVLATALACWLGEKAMLEFWFK